MTTSHLILMIAVAGAVTFGTRLFPFALFGQSKEVPKFIKYLGNVLPVAILGILIVYCLKDFEKGDVNYIIPQLICVALTAGVHILEKEYAFVNRRRHNRIYFFDTFCVYLKRYAMP